MKKRANSLLYKSIRPLVQAKRFVFNRRGDGVHSPYAFYLITKVIRNPYPYDCFRFLAPKYLELSQKLKKDYRDRAVYQIKMAELVFRLATFHKAKNVSLFAQEQSILEPYLLASSKVENLFYHKVKESLEGRGEGLNLDTSLIVLEDLKEDEVKLYLDCFIHHIKLRQEQGKDLMLLLNTNNPILRKRLKLFREELQPIVSLSLWGLEIFVWRDAMTKGQYKVFNRL